MNILFLGAHTDDIELGAGGTMLSLTGKHNLQYVTFSLCKDILRNKTISQDQKNITNSLLQYSIDTIMYDYPNRKLFEHTESIRTKMETIRDKHKPDLVFTHWINDIHQDHKTIAEESIRVFKYLTIFQYECVRSCPAFAPNVYFSLEKKDVQNKWKLLSQYKTQLKTGYVSKKINKAQLKYHGTNSGNEYAESFIIHNMSLGNILCV